VDCVKQQSKVFDTAEMQDYIRAAVVAVVLAWIGSAIASRISFFTILLAPAAGTMIAEAVRALVRKRRSKLLYQVVAVAVVIGSSPLLVMALLLMFANPGFIWNVLWQAVYTFMATSAAYYRLSGISIRK
jgi:F0F1-type ATP synthase membrane subunit c/vacuolar-type H+-ATPase subunit K